MEWSKSTITSAELEKKQREFIEQAMRMAKKSTAVEDTGYEPRKVTADTPEEQAVPMQEITQAEEEIKAEFREEKEDEPAVMEEADFFGEPDAEPAQEEESARSYGVFDADELTGAIESGELTGEGLRQAAEILAEMTSKTEFMKKLLEEQNENYSKTSDNGEDYGLNSFINRHNNSCREHCDGNSSTF